MRRAQAKIVAGSTAQSRSDVNPADLSTSSADWCYATSGPNVSAAYDTDSGEFYCIVGYTTQ